MRDHGKFPTTKIRHVDLVIPWGDVLPPLSRRANAVVFTHLRLLRSKSQSTEGVNASAASLSLSLSKRTIAYPCRRRRSGGLTRTWHNASRHVCVDRAAPCDCTAIALGFCCARGSESGMDVYCWIIH